MSNANDLYRDTRRAAVWGLSVSLGLGAAKLLGGVFGNSLALVSDAAHSLVDATASLALVGALSLAQRPPDREHPYGHARVEALAGATMALVLIGLALGITWGAAVTVNQAHAPPRGFTLAIAGCGALVQEGLYRYAGKVARRTGSRALLATAWDYRLDALGGLIVLTGVGLARWGGPSWQWADHAAALAVAGSILWVGGVLLWDSAQGLMDRQADPDVLDAVRREALAVAGVLGVETLRIRRAGLEYLVDIHVEVDPEQSVRSGHDILVHIEPHRPRRAGPGPSGTGSAPTP